MPWRKHPSNRHFDAELQFHVDQLIRCKVAAGIPENEARRLSILEFGGAEQLKEELRDIHRLPFLETTLTNLKFASRLFRKSPGFSAVVMLTLALGIGANSAVFSAINAIMLRPLPFPQSSQLVEIRQYDRTAKGPLIFAAPVRVEDWNRLTNTFQAISGYYTSDVSDTTGEIPEKVTEALIAPRFFRVWGVAPMLGRDFIHDEERFGGPNAAIISYRLWMHRFNGDRSAIGKSLRLERSAVTVVGVMPADFRFQDRDVDIWINSPVDAPYEQSRDNSWYFQTIGRLKPGVSLAAARSNLTNVQAQLGLLFPKSDAKLYLDLQPLKDLTVADSKTSLYLLYGAVTLLLLIACTNIAALLLARSAEREREISVRYSLGASRGSIVLQLLTECSLLAFMGSALGLLLASVGSSLFRKYAVGFARREEISLDWHIVLYTLLCGVAVTLLCGLVPAIRGTRRNINSALTQFSRSHVSSRNPIQWILVGTQVALAVTLLVGAGLLLRSFQELGRVSAGFETDHVLTFRISGNWGETTDRKALTARIDRTLDMLRNNPGVVAAATAASLPGIPADNHTEIKLLDGPPQLSGKLIAQSRFVSDGYFAALKIPVLTGDTCGRSSQRFSVVINHSFAAAYLATISPVGRHLQFLDNTFGMPPARINGIVADTHEQGLNKAPMPTIYWCGSAPFPTPYFLVQTRSEPMAMAEMLRRQIHLLEPARSVYGISPLAVHLSDDIAPNRLRTFLLSAFALAAIALASTGLYGTLSYFVTMRRRESGLRLALGATREQIVSSFFVKGIRVAALGCAVGLGLSLAFTRTLAGLLFGISNTDWRTFTFVSAAVLFLAALASFVPAFRAASVEPMQVLRDE